MKKTTAFLLCAILTGCTVGPKYHPPVVQPPPAFKEAPPANASGQPAQHPGAGRWHLDRRPTLRCQDSRGLVGCL